MLPFLKITIALDGADQGPDKDVQARIQPGDIASYHDGYHWGCFIYMKGVATPLCSRHTADELEVMIKDYWLQLARAQSKEALKKSLIQ